MTAYPEDNEPCICDGCGKDTADCDGCVESLEAQIWKVRVLRAIQEARTQELHLLQVEFNRQHEDLIETLCKARNDCAQEEARLREMTLEAYEATGNKKPAPGVGIRITKRLIYDEQKAVWWAFDMRYHNLVDINKRNFENVAAGLGLDFVEIKEEPQATIARDL